MDHSFFMQKAISLAFRAAGKTSPNPMVGAVIVRNGRIISSGYHRKAGTPHAEAIAIDAAESSVQGSTLYVSLEPCCHRDKRTPPCTDKIIASGISSVVIAMEDPNPKVSGKGIETLRKAGISVLTGILADKAHALNEAYIKHVSTGLPFVILKTAMTLDGKIATPEGESKWITGEKARRLVHRTRGSVDAILTAIGTVKADDPLMTCRIRGMKSPARIIIDPGLTTPLSSKILSVPPVTILVSAENRAYSAGRKEMLSRKGIRIIEMPGENIDLQELMKILGGMGILSVLVEGGSSLNSCCLEAGIVDKVMFFIAPKIIGGKDSLPVVGGKPFRKLADALTLRDSKIKRIGDDFLIEGHLSETAVRTEGR